MANYVANAATAKRLVDGAGRTVTLVQLGVTIADPSMPWRGPLNPRSAPLSTLVLKAAFLPLGGNIQFGLSKITMDLAKKASATCLIGSTLDLSIYQELIDSRDGSRFKITAVEALIPGDLTLLTFLVLNQ